jgi:hypothetical protein
VLKNVNAKKVQSGLQKTITCTKKYGKRRREWEQACSKNEMQHQKLKALVKTRFANKFIMFEKILQFKNAITLVMVGKILLFSDKENLKPQVWAIVEVMASSLNVVVLKHTMEIKALLLGLST